MSQNHDGPSLADGIGIEYLDGLFGYAMVLTRNHAEAEDLVQETYVRAMQAVGRLRADSNIKGWLFTILRNIWLNQLRKRRNGPQMIEIEVEDGSTNSIVEPSTNSYDLYVSKMETERVQEAIQKLPVQFREIILLREFEDLSYREVASVLDCPVGTVMSRLGRARAKLRTLLAASLEGSASPSGSGTKRIAPHLHHRSALPRHNSGSIGNKCHSECYSSKVDTLLT
jgi:RNA polymerase sigma-70 factor (ECF subfamily)